MESNAYFFFFFSELWWRKNDALEPVPLLGKRCREVTVLSYYHRERLPYETPRFPYNYFMNQLIDWVLIVIRKRCQKCLLLQFTNRITVMDQCSINVCSTTRRHVLRTTHLITSEIKGNDRKTDGSIEANCTVVNERTCYWFRPGFGVPEKEYWTPL